MELSDKIKGVTRRNLLKKLGLAIVVTPFSYTKALGSEDVEISAPGIDINGRESYDKKTNQRYIEKDAQVSKLEIKFGNQAEQRRVYLLDEERINDRLNLEEPYICFGEENLIIGAPKGKISPRVVFFKGNKYVEVNDEKDFLLVYVRDGEIDILNRKKYGRKIPLVRLDGSCYVMSGDRVISNEKGEMIHSDKVKNKQNEGVRAAGNSQVALEIPSDESKIFLDDYNGLYLTESVGLRRYKENGFPWVDVIKDGKRNKVYCQTMDFSKLTEKEKQRFWKLPFKTQISLREAPASVLRRYIR